MPSLLIEIGVEELPAFAVLPALEQFKNGLLTRLESERLGVPLDSVQTFATPRRLTIRINDQLPARQPDAPVEARGPGAKSAYDALGAPTKALLGFAAKQGVPVESIVIEGDYVVARKIEAGKSAAEIIASVVPEIVRSLTFPKFLRWGMGNFRFGRPLRRIVALLDETIIPIEMEGVRSGRETRGHRYTREPVAFEQPSEYETVLRKVFVEPDFAIRRARIIADAEHLAATVDGVALLSENLVTENVFLTEWVTGVLGSFDPIYMSLPRAVLTTSMAKNQRFFPVADKDNNLLPHFIAIRNGDDQHLNTVRAGYESVLASRFNDARFFFENDRRTTLADKTAKTARIVFQEKLGTLADKTTRLQHLMTTTGLLDWTGDSVAAQRAALLAKADLASEIVAELTSLQGIMGREFALLEGETQAVADALYEQYLPKAAGDILPSTKVGTALSLADRVDTLVGYMLFVGAEPKGSSDPFGLKRAATAIVDLLARDATLPPFSQLAQSAESGYIAQGLTPSDKPGNLNALMRTRLEALLDERDIRYDLIDALLEAPWDNIAHLLRRAQIVQQHIAQDSQISVLQPATRIRNILRSVKEPIGIVDTDAITVNAERDLYNALQTITADTNRAIDNGDTETALRHLATLELPINNFFDNVMVLDKDNDRARALRLALLQQADNLYLRIADFTIIVTVTDKLSAD